MASSLVDSLSGDYEPEEFEDDYAEAVTQLVATKIEGGELTETPEAKGEETEVVDLLAALQRSVDKAKAARTGASPGDSGASHEGAAKKAASKPAAKKATTKAAAKKTTAKTTAKKTTTKTASKTTKKKAATKKAS